MKIEVIQYMRPDGRRVARVVEVSDEVGGDYKAMREAGYILAAEVLLTGKVSLTIENHERDADIRLVDHGGESAKDIEDMLKARKWEEGF